MGPALRMPGFGLLAGRGLWQVGLARRRCSALGARRRNAGRKGELSLLVARGGIITSAKTSWRIMQDWDWKVVEW